MIPGSISSPLSTRSIARSRSSSSSANLCSYAPMISRILLRIDLDVVMRCRQFSQKRLRNFPIGWNNDLTVLGVNDVERNFLTQQDVGKRIGQLFDQPLFFAFMFFADCF